MSVGLLQIPPEVIEQIALCSGIESVVGPPTSLVALSSVNRELHSLLSVTNNSVLYAQIYLEKFDNPIDGAVPKDLTSSSPVLAAELRNRFSVLRRLRPCDVSDLSPSEDQLAEMLYTTYIMCLENEEKNFQQLREYAQIDDWLREYWTGDNGASGVQQTVKLSDKDDSRWPNDHAANALAMWIFWFVLQPDQLLADHTATWNVMNVVKMYSLGFHKYQLEYDSWLELRPDLAKPAANYTMSLTYFSKPFSLRVTPMAVPATLTYLTLVDLVQETMLHTFLSLRRGSTEWRQLKRDELRIQWFKAARPLQHPNGPPEPLTPNGLQQNYEFGSIEGIWEGIFTNIDFESYAQMISGGSPKALQRGLIGRHWHSWTIREYYLYSDDKNQSPVSQGEPLRGWLPQDATFTDTETGDLEVWDPIKRRSIQYTKRPVVPRNGGREVRDIIVKGVGHSAMGQFNVYGRIRPTDGLFCLSKEFVGCFPSFPASDPADGISWGQVDGDRGLWSYRGYVVGHQNGQLGGRWRDTVSLAENVGYGGGFIMKRRQ